MSAWATTKSRSHKSFFGKRGQLEFGVGKVEPFLRHQFRARRLCAGDAQQRAFAIQRFHHGADVAVIDQHALAGLQMIQHGGCAQAMCAGTMLLSASSISAGSPGMDSRREFEQIALAQQDGQRRGRDAVDEGLEHRMVVYGMRDVFERNVFFQIGGGRARGAH